jgi:hypothetical protein
MLRRTPNPYACGCGATLLLGARADQVALKPGHLRFIESHATSPLKRARNPGVDGGYNPQWRRRPMRSEGLPMPAGTLWMTGAISASAR